MLLRSRATSSSSSLTSPEESHNGSHWHCLPSDSAHLTAILSLFPRSHPQHYLTYFVPLSPSLIPIPTSHQTSSLLSSSPLISPYRLQVGTPVTADSFAKWSIAKAARKQLEAEARVKAEQAKKKGGKGLCKQESFVMPTAYCHLSSLPSSYSIVCCVCVCVLCYRTE